MISISRTRENIFAKIFLCAFLWIGMMPMVVSAQAETGWGIEQFDSVVTVEKSGTLEIEETISVHFDEPHHGIFRDIPVVYRDEQNNRVKIHVAITSVLQDGATAVYDSSLSGGELAVRIGSPDTMILGDHIYTISYTVSRALLFLKDHDEVYWNVTGSDWNVPILQTTAVVVLPEEAELGQAHCYAQDPSGGDQEDACGVARKGTSVAFAAQGPMTVAVGFAKGLIEEPTAWNRLEFFLMDNWAVALPLLMAAAVGVLWWKRGRDPREGTVIAEYEPPEGILAVYAGAFAQEYPTKQHVVAMIIQMAVLGHLIIESTTTEEGIFHTKHLAVTLHKKTNGAGLDTAHKMLFEALFVGGKESTLLSDIKGTIKPTTLQAIRQQVVTYFEDRGYYTKRSFVLRMACFFLAGTMWVGGMTLAANLGGAFEISAILSGIVIAGFGWFMPQRTLAGAELHRRVKGFALFMHTAERYRSAWQEREGIFATYLPYAIAFNDVKHWAQVFDGLEQQPLWYRSNLGVLSATALGDDLMGVSQMMGTALAPTSTGAGGGGHVGGGFGGGGGGAW